MKRRGKIIATITTMCLALVMLTFGVLAATTVSFNIGGTVSYKVDDVLCRINTQLYYSKNNTVLKYADAYNAGYDLSQAETLPQDIEEVPDEYFTGKEIRTYNKETGALVQLTEQDLIFDDILLPLGRYDESSDEVKSYKYYLVIEVENYGENNISVAVTDNTTVENASKLSNLQRDITNNGVSIAKDETKKVVVAFSLQNVTEGISSTDFSYSVLVEEDKSTLTTVIVNSLDNSGEETQLTSEFNQSTTIQNVRVNKEMINYSGSEYPGYMVNLTLQNIPDSEQINITIDSGYEAMSGGLYTHYDTVTAAVTDLLIYQNSNQTSKYTDNGVFLLSNRKTDNSLDICIGAMVMLGDIAEDVLNVSVTLSYPSSDLVSKVLYEYSNGEYSVYGNSEYFTENENDVVIEQGEIETYKIYADGRAYNVTKVKQQGFRYENLTSIYIPDSVISIGVSAFGNCSTLSNVTMGNGVQEIGDVVFFECFELSNLILPDSVKSIGMGAFSYCSKLNVSIGDNVEKIGWGAFMGTKYDSTVSNWQNDLLYLTSRGNKKYLIDAKTSLSGAFNLSADVQVVADGVLSQTSITEVTVDENNPRYTSKIGEVETNSIIRVGEDNAYTIVTVCNNLVLVEGVTEIGDSAFYKSTITSVTIPNSVTTIGNYAFSEWTSAQSIYCLRMPENLATNWNYGCNAKIYLNGVAVN